MHKKHVVDAEIVLSSLRTEPDLKPAPGTREMLIRLGANLVLFNQIELCFKHVLRDAAPSNGEFDSDPLASILRTLEKQPLGNVAKLLTSLIDPAKQLGFADYLAAVVDSRNQLVHHFFQIPGVSLVEEGPTVAVKWLKHQHDFCLPLKTMGEELFAALLYAKERRAAENGEQLVVDAWRDHWQ